jgi:TolB-like protein/DNA-binding response OmpR family regulator
MPARLPGPVLVIAEDAALRARLVRLLAPSGYAVELAEGAKRGREVAAGGRIALAIAAPERLAELKPDVLREIGGACGGLIMLVAPGPESERWRAALPEADAHLPLPLDEPALLRAIADIVDADRAADSAEPPLLRFAGFTLDQAGHSLRNATGEEVTLTRAEFSLLVAFTASPGRVMSRDQLLNVAAGRDMEAYDRSVDVLVGRLRRKVEAEPKKPELIVTVPGVGYKFTAMPTALSVGPHRSPSRETRSDAGPALALPDKASIAVLPFQNLSGDPEQAYFADGVVEDIITALSRLPWLFVIARNSSFTFKGRVVDTKQVGRELGVRYILEGSVRKAANRVRITGQLIEAGTGMHLWADRFDGVLADIFDLQDQVTTRVVGALAPPLEKAEIERAKRKPTDSLDAYDFYLRGMASVYRWTQTAHAEALRLFYRAIELDPDFAMPYGMAARCYAWRNGNGWTTDRDHDRAEAARLAKRVSEIGKEDAVALSFGGLALARVVGDLDGGAQLIDRALLLNPNLAAAWLASGWVRVWLGDTAMAIDHFARSMRLSPIDPQIFSMQAGTAWAHFFAGRDEEAIAWAEKAVREQPAYLPGMRILVAALALAGRAEEGARAAAALLKLDPGGTVSALTALSPVRQPADLQRYAEGLRRAGLPE